MLKLSAVYLLISNLGQVMRTIELNWCHILLISTPYQHEDWDSPPFRFSVLQLATDGHQWFQDSNSQFDRNNIGHEFATTGLS
ncbi:hypothetical protein TNCV_293281 [Trichonephila clavipes]|nr:hypothetical protein TNCV_293281 [Trichonephila clavipes]